MYYLQSRYYDPEIGRFINGDMPEIIVFGQNSTIPNLMSYCYNEPVNKLDSNGQLAANIISGIVGALINVILDFITSALIYWVTHKFTFNKFKYNLFSASTLLAAASGFASGLLISSKYKRWVCAVGSGLIGGFTNIIYCIIKRRKISIFDLLVDVCFGLLWGYLGGSGVGNSYWKKSLFCKGGYFVYKGYKYSVSTSLRLIKPVIKDFVKSFAKYIGTQMADWLQKFVRKKV